MRDSKDAVTQHPRGRSPPSEGRLRPAQRNALKDGEVAGKGVPGVHAEVNGVNSARTMGLTPTSVSPSRPACPGCQSAMKQENVKIIDK